MADGTATDYGIPQDMMEPTFWTILDKVVSDSLTYQVPMSVVLIILAVVVGVPLLRSWWKKPGSS